MLFKEHYNDRKRADPFTRLRKKHKETGGIMRYGLRTENERIKKIAEYNSSIDHAKRNMKMIHYPVWRKPDKTKFKGMRRGQSAQDFNHHTNPFPLENKAAWHQLPVREKDQEIDYYKLGFQDLGNKLSLRQRRKQLEVSKDLLTFLDQPKRILLG